VSFISGVGNGTEWDSNLMSGKKITCLVFMQFDTSDWLSGEHCFRHGLKGSLGKSLVD
jgi:hypothetical protein